MDDEGGEQRAPEDTGSISQFVQFATAGSYNLNFYSTKRNFTGVLSIPLKSDASIWASCGVTFISPHFAVTAAHCVPKDRAAIDTRAFFVSNPNADQLVTNIISNPATAAKFQQSMEVVGTFPNWSQATYMSNADGLINDEPNGMTCGVVVRCHTSYGTERCPNVVLQQDGGRGVDMALIYCPERPANRPWTRVYPGSDYQGQKVEVHWYHELLNLSATGNDGIGPAGNFNNYGYYDPWGGDAAKANNWHYRGLFFNQFYPLISRTLPDGTQYQATSAMTAGNTERYTNLYGCHGTSGSGAFPQGAGGDNDKLLGPMVHGNSAWTNRLCTPPNLLTSTTNNLSFVRPFFTRELERLPFVLADRPQ